MAVKIKAVEFEEALQIIPDLRVEDRLEIARLGSTPEDAVREGYEQSLETLMAYVDGDRACIMGVSTVCYLGDVGCPWFLTTPVMDRMSSKKELLKKSREIVNFWASQYDVLENYVDAQYDKSLRWLKWLGFTIHKPKKNPLTGAHFCRVTMEKR